MNNITKCKGFDWIKLPDDVKSNIWPKNVDWVILACVTGLSLSVVSSDNDLIASLIHERNWAMSVYIPGNNGLAQPFPVETIPVNEPWQTRGPPESP